MPIDSWVLANLLCLAWLAISCVLLAVIEFEVQDLRFWIPNRTRAVLDLARLAMLGLAIGGGVLVGGLSLIASDAIVLAGLTLALSLALAGYLVAALLSTPGGRGGGAAWTPGSLTLPGKMAGEVALVVGGDVSFDRRLEAPKVSAKAGGLGMLSTTLTWLTRAPAYPVPRLLSAAGDAAAGGAGPHGGFAPVPVPGGEAHLEPAMPFHLLKEVFAEGDVVALNLESPLAQPGRYEGYRLTSEPRFAKSLQGAGVNLVNLANNHCFDAGEPGLRATFEALDGAGVRFFGAGSDLASVRRGVLSNVGGLRLAWLGYTQKMGRVTLDYAAATTSRCGCLPLDPDIACADIEAARRRADVVIVSPHWGVEDRHGISNTVRRIGQRMIDAGATAVLGHGPHLYQGIEIHRGCPIVYSLGTLVFGTRSQAWKDNILVKLVLKDGSLARLEIIPVAGDLESLLQPAPLEGERAEAVLSHLIQLSRRFKTTIRRVGDRGIIDLAEPPESLGAAGPPADPA